MEEEEEIQVSEDDIRKEIIREWCGKVTKNELPEIKKDTSITKSLMQSDMILKVQKRISVILEKSDNGLPGLIFDLESDNEFNS